MAKRRPEWQHGDSGGILTRRFHGRGVRSFRLGASGIRDLLGPPYGWIQGATASWLFCRMQFIRVGRHLSRFCGDKLLRLWLLRFTFINIALRTPSAILRLSLRVAT